MSLDYIDWFFLYTKGIERNAINKEIVQYYMQMREN